MQINGKEFKFKRASFPLKKRAEEFFNKELVPKAGLIDTEAVGSQGWEEIRERWKHFCEIIFEKWDDEMDLNNITEEEMLETPRSFFGFIQTNSQKSNG